MKKLGLTVWELWLFLHISTIYRDSSYATFQSLLLLTERSRCYLSHNCALFTINVSLLLRNLVMKSRMKTNLYFLFKREVRELCDHRVHFYQSLQESELKSAHPAVKL